MEPFYESFSNAGEHSSILVRTLQTLEGESRAAPVRFLCSAGCKQGETWVIQTGKRLKRQKQRGAKVRVDRWKYNYYASFDDFWCMKQNGCDFTRLRLLRAVYLLSFKQQLMLPPGLELARPLRSWTTSLRTSACVSCDCCKGGGPFRLKVWENKCSYDILDLYLVVRPFPQVVLLRMAMIRWAREPLDIQWREAFCEATNSIGSFCGWSSPTRRLGTWKLRLVCH